MRSSDELFGVLDSVAGGLQSDCCCREQRNSMKETLWLPSPHVPPVKQIRVIAQECAETLWSCDAVLTMMTFISFSILLHVRRCPHSTSAHWFSHPLRCVLSLYPLAWGVWRWCADERRNVVNEQHVSSGPAWFIIHTVNWVSQQCCWEFNEIHYTKALRDRWIIYCHSSDFSSVLCLCDSCRPPWLILCYWIIPICLTVLGILAHWTGQRL